ncbi:MAG: class I SAM-dependent methyltransferase [Halomonadaceae bacterium]|nr:MAG: class I SAM-dependent methyltransferase [Halomonadaceae bacterium]
MVKGLLPKRHCCTVREVEMPTNTAPDIRTQQQLADWFMTPLGQAMLTQQQALVEACIQGSFGARQLECGLVPQLSLVGHHNSWLQWQAVTTGDCTRDPVHSPLLCLHQELPFQDDDLDLVVLHHSLDLSHCPHRVLREAARVLRPGGQLLLVGFNPWSLWGLRRTLGRARTMPWSAGFLRAHRLTDWMRVLDFAVDRPRYQFFRPPTQNPRLLSRLAFMEPLSDHGGALPWGAFYVLCGEKRQSATLRLKREWQQRSKVVAMPLANGQASRYRQPQDRNQ